VLSCTPTFPNLFADTHSQIQATETLTFVIPLFYTECDCSGWSSNRHLDPCTDNSSTKRQSEPGFHHTKPNHLPPDFFQAEKSKSIYVWVSYLGLSVMPSLILPMEWLQLASYSQSIVECLDYLQNLLFITNHPVILIRCIFIIIFLRYRVRSKLLGRNVLRHIAISFLFWWHWSLNLGPWAY
jgi:hypothetical protein